MGWCVCEGEMGLEGACICGAGGGESVPKSLLFLVEVAVCIIFPEFTGLVVAEFTMVAFGMMMVLILAKALALLILGRTDTL